MNCLLHPQCSFDLPKSLMLSDQVCINAIHFFFFSKYALTFLSRSWVLNLHWFCKSLPESFIVSCGLLLLSFFTDVLCCFTSKPVTLSPPKRGSKGFCLKLRVILDSKFFFNKERRKKCSSDSLVVSDSSSFEPFVK